MRYLPMPLLLAALAGCASVDKPTAPAPAAPPAAAANPLAPLIGSLWLAEDINGRGVAPHVQSTLRFDSVSKVSGSGGCNRYNGGARSQTGTVMFGPIETTRMACAQPIMQQETSFFDALVGARGVERDGDALYFLDITGSRSLRFTKVTAPPSP